MRKPSIHQVLLSNLKYSIPGCEFPHAPRTEQAFASGMGFGSQAWREHAEASMASRIRTWITCIELGNKGMDCDIFSPSQNHCFDMIPSDIIHVHELLALSSPSQVLSVSLHAAELVFALPSRFSMRLLTQIIYQDTLRLNRLTFLLWYSSSSTLCFLPYLLFTPRCRIQDDRKPYSRQKSTLVSSVNIEKDIRTQINLITRDE